MHPTSNGKNRRLTAAAIALAIILSHIPAASAGSTAANITDRCTFAPSSNSTTFKYATDGDYTTKWASAKTSSRYIDFTVAAGYEVGGIYFIWSSAPASWALYAFEDSGAMTSVLEGGTEGYLTQFVYIPSEYAAYRRFRLSMTPASASSAVDIAELKVFGPGDAPYYAPRWEPFSGRADLLTIVAHPDDEDLYMGVPAPTYADQGMRCATVYMTYGSASASVRRYEAQESAWCLGNRCYPAMGNFRDVKTSTWQQQTQYWPLDETVGFIVEQIRRFKPSVIVTHDVNGEYGHGAHKLTQYATALAFQYAADASKYPESAAQYGTWKAGKLYVHLYGTNALNTMSLTATLSSFGGRTVLQVISDAYNRHDSQLPGRSLPTSGDYDMRKFGLFATNLGLDAARNSMFEHVTEEAMLQLNSWYIYEVVDRAALTQALDDAKTREQGDYTPESWADAGLPAIIAAAQAVMDNREAIQTQVDEQTALLTGATDKLVAYLSSLRIASPPDKLAYIVGEALDLTGLAVTAVYSDDAEKKIDASDASISGFDSALPAAGQAVSVSYADAYSTQTASFFVDILPVGGEQISSSVYTIDREKRIVADVAPGTTAEQLYANFSNDASGLKLYSWNGSEYTGGAITTGMVIKLTVGGVVTDSLRIAVLGDVSGDGIIDVNDILYIRGHITGRYQLKACQIVAADVSVNTVIDVEDILYVRAHITGRYLLKGERGRL